MYEQKSLKLEVGKAK